MNAVVLENVSKRYGSKLALDRLCLSIPRGSVCGLIGPNGSGKTTTMGLIAGLLRAESGSIDVLGAGRFVASTHAGRVSLMPQDSVPAAHASLLDSLVFYARLQGLSARDASKESERWLEKVELKDRARSRWAELSHGMRRRFSVAQAMLGSPELVLLDEPTSGLDPELVVLMRDLFVAERGKRTLLISSHILSELQSMCDHAIFMERGRALRQGSMAEVTNADSVIRVKLCQEPNLDQLGADLPACSLRWEEPHLVVTAPRSEPLESTNARVLQGLLDQQVGILELSSGNTLESTYLQVKRGG